MRNQQIRGKLVRGVNQPASPLKPWLETPRSGKKIPAQNHWSNAGSGEGAAALRPHKVARPCRAGIEKSRTRIRRRRICLPKRHDVGAEFELTGKYSSV